MQKGQKSKRNGIEDFLCPFTDMYITQASGVGTHKGTCAIDVRGKESGVRYPYYAPCTVKCIKTYPSYGQAMWQSVESVRCPNGYIGKVTFMTVHDNSFDAYVGQIVPQGNQLGNMGDKPTNAVTGVHCHIEASQSADTSWTKNQYGIYHFNNEKYLDDVCFVDNTNIIKGLNGNWRTTSQVPVSEGKNYVNLPPTVDSWAVYDINVAPVKKNAKASLNPMKFGGLSYYVYEYRDNGTTAVIETSNFGRSKIYIKDTPAKITIDSHIYNRGNF